MAVAHASNAQIEREARIAGLRDDSAPSLETVERRRIQLWAVTIVLLLAVPAGVALVSSWRPAGGSVITPTVVRVGIVLLAGAFGFYAIEKELHLHRLSRLLIDQRTLASALAERLEDMSLLIEAGKAMNSILELPAVLDSILRSAIELLSGGSGSIMLLETTDHLVTVLAQGTDAAVGRRVRVGSGIPGHVAETRQALLVEGQGAGSEVPGLTQQEANVSALSVPLVSRGKLLGVLNVYADEGRRFAGHDLQVACLFAEHAAGAIANARLYEAQRIQAERAELASEFGRLNDDQAR